MTMTAVMMMEYSRRKVYGEEEGEEDRDIGKIGEDRVGGINFTNVPVLLTLLLSIHVSARIFQPHHRSHFHREQRQNYESVVIVL